MGNGENSAGTVNRGKYSGAISGHYRGRVAYAAPFFEKLASRLGLDGGSVVLDLACGSGELAAGLSGFVGWIHGFDRSGDMLEQARARAIHNATFHESDLNSAPVELDGGADLVTIGRAIPYLDRPVLKETLSASLRVGGSVIVCGAGFTRETPWLGAYRALRKRLIPDRAQLDFQGMQAMKYIGYSYLGSLSHRENASYTDEDIMAYALSYDTQTRAILDDPDRFRAMLEETLAPYGQADGTFAATEISWGHVFRPQPAGP